jgi:hypothetical protein
MTQIASGVQTIQVRPSRDPRWQKQGAGNDYLAPLKWDMSTTEDGANLGVGRQEILPAVKAARPSSLLGRSYGWPPPYQRMRVDARPISRLERYYYK